MADTNVTTATAYGPEPTLAEVIVLGGHAALCVAEEHPVQVETLPGGRGDWAQPGMRLTVRRIQLGHIQRPGYNRHAAVAARCAMSGLAGRMHPTAGDSLRRADPVTYWDLRTSMDDQRAALCLATGIPVEHVSRDGYDISRPAGAGGERR